MSVGAISSISPITSAWSQEPAVRPAPASAPADTYGGQKQSGSSSIRDPMGELITGYTTTVGGTHYSGSVDQSGEGYTASIANLMGSTVSGSSVLSAENNLRFRIDVLV